MQCVIFHLVVIVAITKTISTSADGAIRMSFDTNYSTSRVVYLRRVFNISVRVVLLFDANTVKIL